MCAVICCLLCLFAAVSPIAAGEPPAAGRPNILLILVDDMGWGDLGVFHQNQRARKRLPAIRTPHLDRLSAEGAQLRRHYAASPVCAPARASLFSGVHQGHAEVIRNSNFDAPLENTHTLASMLREAGYSTALIGKWGLGGGREQGGTPETSSAWPTKRGFDFFFGYNNHITGHRHYPKEDPAADPDTGHNAVWESSADKSEDISQNCDGCYSTDLFTARAKKWIADQKKAAPGKPFFLALTLVAPHARLAVPAAPYPKGGGLRGGVQWLGKPGRMINTAIPGKWDTFIPSVYAKQKDWPEFARRHATVITRIDDAVGDLTQLLKDLKIDGQTMIVFLSDNGPHDEAGAVKGSPAHPAPIQNPSFFQSYGVFDGIKRDCWEGGLRVPALVRFPGTVKPGLVTLSPSQFQDWMATFADLAGVSVPMRSDGVSLMPLLAGKPAKQRESAIYTEFFYNGATPDYKDFAPTHTRRARGQMQVVYVDGLKGVRYNVKSADDPFEIYDTAKDPGERKNLAQQHPDLQKRMEAEALRSRRAFDYTWSGPRRNNPISGSTLFDKVPVPAVQNAPDLEPGLSSKQVSASPAWVPAFDTLPEANEAAAGRAANPADWEFPAGTVTELKGYLRVPETGPWTFHAALDAVPGSKAYIKLHRFHLVDADFNYKPGETVSSSMAVNATEGRGGRKPVYLEAGLHPITITVVQGDSAPGRLRFSWQKGNGGIKPVPAEAFFTPRP